MPKFIGNSIEGAKRIEDNACSNAQRVKLSFSQAILMPEGQVECSLDTTDTGSKGSYAKRWYHWFATPENILANPQSTKLMKIAAHLTLEYRKVGVKVVA